MDKIQYNRPMVLGPITPEQKDEYNKVVTHPLQSYEWGEFREKTGVTVIRRGLFENDTLVDGFTLTIHKIPRTHWTIGYLPKGKLPTKQLLQELQKIGKEKNCIFIQLEPDVVATDDAQSTIKKFGLKPAAHPLFTKYTFTLDLEKSDEELLKNMHPKTRYNIKVAQKHNVEIKIDNSDNAFIKYVELTEATTKRQGFYAHTRKYHKDQWESLSRTSSEDRVKDTLSSFLLTALYDKKILTVLLFFVFKDTLYYPYGASSDENRNVMHSTLAMWEGILLGKKMGLTSFDMWGAATTENPITTDPYYGFHRFKQGFGATYTEFVGSYDLVINNPLYPLYKVMDKARWAYLKIKK